MPTPKYVQIKEYLKNEALKPEAVNTMPSVRTLMRRFNVAMVTVNQALLELEHEQVIIRRQAYGEYPRGIPGLSLRTALEHRFHD